MILIPTTHLLIAIFTTYNYIILLDIPPNSALIIHNVKFYCICTFVTIRLIVLHYLYYIKQETHCTYNITLGAFTKPQLSWKSKNITYVCARTSACVSVLVLV
jgi:hypothetical protein